jgi:glutamine synthetase
VQSQRDYVLRTVEERGIRFVQLWFTDVLGTAKAFNITPAELENALDEGMTFDGSAIDGFSRVQEADVLARPDLKTFQLLSWHGEDRHGEGKSVARVFCDIVNLDGTAFEGDPRHALRRTLERARAAGYTFFASSATRTHPIRRPSSTPGRTSTSASPTYRARCGGGRC